MTVQEAISARHSVRTYLTKPVEPAIVNALRAEIRACNAEGGLHIQLVMNEPMAFRGFFAHYGKFRGVCNYIVLAGKRAKDLDERAGWFGERLVLLAQTLGLNTCWVGLTFSKAVARRSYVLAPDERLVCVIAFGYGAEQGEAHESRPMREVYRADRALPEWFSRGLKAALLAPTAMNQQRFRFTLLPDDTVRAESRGGSYSHVDLGIVKYHFQLGAGRESFDRFRLDYYPAEYDPDLGTSPREIMKKVYERAVRYAQSFAPGARSLLFSGATGLGKTFLSACIARTVADRGYSVCYVSAEALFADFEQQKFRPREGEDVTRKYLACDLLILDDLGTEMVTSFSVSALYQLINTRLNSAKPTIISTNCTMDELERKYGPQIMSRLEGEYLLLTFHGRDIRLQRKERGI